MSWASRAWVAFAVKAALAKDADEKTVRAKIEAVAKIQTDIAMMRLKAVQEIAPTLTDEQKTQMNERPGMAYGSLFGGTVGMGSGGRRGGGGGRNQ
jgi:Spy/CpxP family protein refolding chaperone